MKPPPFKAREIHSNRSKEGYEYNARKFPSPHFKKDLRVRERWIREGVNLTSNSAGGR